MSKSKIVYTAIGLGMVLSPVAWLAFDSPMAAAVTALMCYVGCELYGLVSSQDWPALRAAVRRWFKARSRNGKPH